MQPETTFKVGDVRAAVFLNHYPGRNGRADWSSYSVHIHSRFEKEPNVWESTSSFKLYQLPQVALALQLATEYVATREAEVAPAGPTKSEGATVAETGPTSTSEEY